MAAKKKTPKQRKAVTGKARGTTGRKLSQRKATNGRFGAVARTLSLLNQQMEALNQGFAELAAYTEEIVKLNELKAPLAPEEMPEPIELAPVDANGSPVVDYASGEPHIGEGEPA